MSSNLGITPRTENYSDWYNDLVAKAELAEDSAVRGCMTIKPHGYALWELMQRALDDMFKATGHVNAYFPLFIPKSFFEKEAQHVEGFAKECAVVTHYRLKANPKGKGLIPDPDAELEEPLIIRPTSETIIWNTYKKWIQSYRDLPLLINQWANVVRWEMRTRKFLRTAEFLWQEGHTAHATYDEAEQEALTIMNECYGRFAEEWMAVPVIKGVKSEGEKFAGADHTYTMEALTQDLRAIQNGTSHHLGQNFAKAFDVTFQSAEGKLEYVYATSWGVSTRMIGTLIMVHSDDKGFVCPPRLAPVQVVILPIGRSDDDWCASVQAAKTLKEALEANPSSHSFTSGGRRIALGKMRVRIDEDRKNGLGFRLNQWDLKGACMKIEVGPRDLIEGFVTYSVRMPDTEVQKHQLRVPHQLGQTNDMNRKWLRDDPLFRDLRSEVRAILRKLQGDLYARALKLRDDNTHRVDTWEEFKAAFPDEGGGGFVVAHWDGTQETEDRIADETKATIRCIPLTPLEPSDNEPGKCVLTGKPSKQRVVFARAY